MKQSLVKVPNRPRRPPRNLATPMYLTSLAVLGLFLAAVLFGYLKSPPPTLPAIVQTDGPQEAAPILAVTETSDDVAVGRWTRARSGKQTRTASSAKARLRRETSRLRLAELREIQQEDQETSRDKPTKIAAILKTTWSVLKKPFQF